MESGQFKCRYRSLESVGFSLIELMIAVAIIAILAATAVVGFERYKLETKKAEIGLIFNRMFNDQVAYYHKPRVVNNAELEPCFIFLYEQPHWAGYSTGLWRFPVDFTNEDTRPMDPEWPVVGIPTFEKVNFTYEVSGSITGIWVGMDNDTPICASDYQVIPARGIYLEFRAHQDLDRDGTLSRNYLRAYVEEDGTIVRWLQGSTNPNPYE